MRRFGLVIALGGGAAGLLASQVGYLWRHPEVWPPDDSIEYWAAAHLLRQGQNPYAAELLLPLQQAGGRSTDTAVMMWNPPWTLAVVLPLAWLSARAAQLFWLAVQASVLLYCGDRLWRMYGGSSERRWVGWLLTLAWLPSLFALQAGQITPLVLLGAVLWMDSQTARRSWQAGIALGLLAIKPHLVILLGMLQVFWIVQQRQWTVLLAGAAAAALAVGVVMLGRPAILLDYGEALLHRPPAQWYSPTLGAYLRAWLGAEYFSLQFVPTLLGLVALGAAMASGWPRHWCWRTLTPPLLLASFVVAPYGAWPFDLVLLLPAGFFLLLQQAPRLGTWSFWMVGGTLAAIDLGCLLFNLFRQPSYTFGWVAPAVALLYGTIAILTTISSREREKQGVNTA
jgi:hypothetical protein